MSDIDKALQTQIENIESLTGKSLDQLVAIILDSPLKKHGELVGMVKTDFGLGHGHANTLVHLAKKARKGDDAGSTSTEAKIDEIYSGKKQSLRPLHDALMSRIKSLGEFEVAPKKAYTSLRRKKQFATVGPGSKGRLELGLNMKDVPAAGRLEELPAGKMCQYRVYLTEASEVDDQLLDWVKIAYDSAG